MKIKFGLFFASTAVVLWAAEPSVATIIQNSVQANHRDFDAALHFDNKETERKGGDGTKTYQDLMIDGSPYQRLIAVNGKPLSTDQQNAEAQKERRERQKRAHESADERKTRITKFERERRRDNQMMNQLSVAFNFKLEGTQSMRGFNVYVLKATPRPDYKPINMSTQVLPGMMGELWIDKKTFQWVKVTAKVIHPVSIEGFLAQVEPGTDFELEKSPVGDGSAWLVTHFAMHSNAKVLYMFSHNAQEDDTFWDYQPTK
jgi:hypothetical protein